MRGEEDCLSYVVHHGDGLAGLEAMPRGSVALVVNDPPWGCTRAKWDRPLDWRRWWSAIDHALADDGTLITFASVRLACAIVPLAPRRRPYRYDLIWRKNRASGHLNARRAPLRGHETLLVFGRALYAPQLTGGHRPMNPARRVSKSELYGTERVTSSNAGTTYRYPTSVLAFPAVANNAARIHATQKPIPLLRWLVRAYSMPGHTVVDPTCGSGAVIHAARDEGRVGVGWEVDAEIAASAQEWLAATETLFARRAA